MQNRDFASLRFCDFGGQLSGKILVETIIYKVMPKTAEDMKKCP